MIKPKKGALRVELAGKQHFICVPAGRAQDLFDYLRKNRVQSTPPEPSFSGFDCIELPNVTDVDSVQKLLNTWS